MSLGITSPAYAATISSAYPFRDIVANTSSVISKSACCMCNQTDAMGELQTIGARIRRDDAIQIIGDGIPLPLERIRWS
ncbi:MAG TPA: hypothetical protein VFV60_01970 [bacterium]|nr:hypothetical protein [bacterium]